MNSDLLLYQNIAEYKKQAYKDLLTREHVVGSIHIKSAYFPDDVEATNIALFGYELLKDGKRYVVADRDKSGKHIELSSMLPIMATHIQQIAAKGQVYYWIRKPITARFKPETTLGFRGMVDLFSSFSHSNPKHQKLFWFMAIAQMISRCNFRVATPPSFGKDSTVDILGNLVDGAATIENPTIAKLEDRANCMKLLAVNEVVGMSGENWRAAEQFLLAAGAFKPTITKRSRAYGSVKEVIDISDFSLLLMYNDVDDYTGKEFDNYFDFIAKRAIKDRFPALRLHGKLTHDFNAALHVDPTKFVEQHLDEYKSLVYEMSYTVKNFYALIHGYDKSGLNTAPERWMSNIRRLLDIIDIYCESQEEFDEWVKTINDCITDYDIMVCKYPRVYEQASDKLSPSELRDAVAASRKKRTYKDKIEVIEMAVRGEKMIEDRGLGDFW